jgi:peptidoglycan lytic transglycosylase
VKFGKYRMQAFGLAAAAMFAVVCLQASEVEASGSQCGKASWYKMGQRTASGEKMNAGALAAAHRTLPFGTKVRVENLRNGKSVVVRINDRGPFSGGRVIDVTQGAAQRLGMIRSGVARVKVTVVGGKGQLGGC